MVASFSAILLNDCSFFQTDELLAPAPQIYINLLTCQNIISSPGYDFRVIVESMDDVDADSLKSAAEHLIETLQDPAAVVLGSSPSEGKVSLVAAFTPGVVSLGVQAGKFIGPIAKLCGGGGGGRPNFAQAGGKKPENLLSALDKARDDLVAILSKQAS